MGSFLEYFAKRHLLANIFTFSLIFLGLYTLTHIKRESFPVVEFGELQIITRYPGASPEDVELKVTNKLEDELKHVSGIDYYVSYSLENISVIRVVLDVDYPDQDTAKSDIKDAVNRVTDLPIEVTESPLIKEIKSTIMPMIEVGIVGDIEHRRLRNIAKLFEKKLKDIKGVSRVERFGYRAREIRIELSPEKIHHYRVPIFDILQAIQARNIRATSGSFESYTDEKNIVTLAQFEDPLEVGDVIVRSTFEGPLIKVRDLGVVKDDFEEEKFVSRVNGKSGISFVVFNTETADLIRTVDAVKQLADREREHLPPGVEIIYSSDASRYVRSRLGIAASNGIMGLILVLLVLSCFLSTRAAIWVALGIPVTVFGSIAALPLLGIHMDSITLSSIILVLGIIVDDAIIISESIHRQYERGIPPLQAAVQGVKDVFFPVLTTVLTTFIAFAPMFFMKGMMGNFIFVIPATVSLALFFSFTECVIALPAHLAHALSKNKNIRQTDGGKKNWFAKIRLSFARFMLQVIRLRYLCVLGFLSALLASLLFAYNFIDFILFPSYSADQFYIMLETPTGSSLQATSTTVKKMEGAIKRVAPEEIVSYVSRVGLTGLRVIQEGENYAFMSVSLTPFSERERTADQIVEALRTQFAKIDNIATCVFWIEGGGPPVDRALQLRTVGPDDLLRKELASDVEKYLKHLPGTKDIDRDDKAGKPEVEIKLDYDRLSRLGLNVADVANNVRIAYDGKIVGNVRYGDEDVDFRVVLEKTARQDLDGLGDFLIPNRRGKLIPLHKVARLKEMTSQASFNHYNGERAITIGLDVDKTITTPLTVADQVRQQFVLGRDYPGMRIAAGGEAKESEKSIKELRSTFILAAVGVYLALVLLFGSLTQPLLIMLTIPFGIIGVVVGFGLHNEPLGFIGFMGVIGLIGVVVNDGLVLVSHINNMRILLPDRPLGHVLALASSDRLRAIIMTTVTTVAGVMPLAYGIGGVDPYMTQMAMALGYGLIFATVLTLVLLPCLFAIADDIRRMLKRVLRT